MKKQLFKRAYGALRAGICEDAFLSAIWSEAPPDWDRFYEGEVGDSEFRMAREVRGSLRRLARQPGLAVRLATFKADKRAREEADWLAEQEALAWAFSN